MECLDTFSVVPRMESNVEEDAEISILEPTNTLLSGVPSIMDSVYPTTNDLEATPFNQMSLDFMGDVEEGLSFGLVLEGKSSAGANAEVAVGESFLPLGTALSTCSSWGEAWCLCVSGRGRGVAVFCRAGPWHKGVPPQCSTTTTTCAALTEMRQDYSLSVSPNVHITVPTGGQWLRTAFLANSHRKNQWFSGSLFPSTIQGTQVYHPSVFHHQQLVVLFRRREISSAASFRERLETDDVPEIIEIQYYQKVSLSLSLSIFLYVCV